jgi:hypothetical protein
LIVCDTNTVFHFSGYWSFIMNKHFIAAIIIAASAAVAAPVFASSGYGPAPHYNPVAGAPASQRGQSTDTIRAENANAEADARSYGGVQDTASQWGSRGPANNAPSLFSHH